MTTIKIRYLVRRTNGDGRVRYYWQPSAQLKALGWRCIRLRDGKGRPIVDEGEAIAAAEKRNRELDARQRDRASPVATKKPDQQSVQGTTDQVVESERRQGVYVIGPSQGPVKIGRAHDPVGRMKDLQVGHPTRLFLWLFWREPGGSAVALEGAVKGAWAARCTTGEWYAATATEGMLCVIRQAFKLRRDAARSPAVPDAP